MKPAKSRAPMLQNLVCNEETPPPKNTLQAGIELDDDCFAGNEEDESDTNTSDNDSDSGCSDYEVYI